MLLKVLSSPPLTTTTRTTCTDYLQGHIIGHEEDVVVRC